MEKLNTEIFIVRAKIVHKDCEYDYSKVEYKTNKSKVIIICKIHGEFLQKPASHLAGYGCKKCAVENHNKQVTYTKEIFINKAILIHGDKYNYSLVNYRGALKYITIVCKDHGQFSQKPYVHLSGSGCPICGKIAAHLKLKYNTEEFIDASKKIHNNIYNYSLTKYNSIFGKVKIICNKHGVFEQEARVHLDGSGCPKCNHNISKISQKWLFSLNNGNIIPEYRIKIDKKTYIVDGFDPESNTIYEFLGDFWHGNPKMFSQNDLNSVAKKTFGELYNKTIDRINLLKVNGFEVIFIWESDFKLKGI